MTTNDWLPFRAPVLRRVKRLEHEYVSDTQSVSATSTLTLTHPNTFVEATTSAITVSLPSANLTRGFAVTLHNASGGNVTFNSLTVNNGSFAQFTSTGAAWRRSG